MNRYHFRVPPTSALYFDIVAETAADAVRLAREQLLEQLSKGCAIQVPLEFIGNATLFVDAGRITSKMIWGSTPVEEHPPLKPPVSVTTAESEELRA